MEEKGGGEHWLISAVSSALDTSDATVVEATAAAEAAALVVEERSKRALQEADAERVQAMLAGRVQVAMASVKKAEAKARAAMAAAEEAVAKASAEAEAAATAEKATAAAKAREEAAVSATRAAEATAVAAEKRGAAANAAAARADAATAEAVAREAAAVAVAEAAAEVAAVGATAGATAGAAAGETASWAASAIDDLQKKWADRAAAAVHVKHVAALQQRTPPQVAPQPPAATTALPAAVQQLPARACFLSETTVNGLEDVVLEMKHIIQKRNADAAEQQRQLRVEHQEMVAKSVLNYQLAHTQGDHSSAVQILQHRHTCEQVLQTQERGSCQYIDGCNQKLAHMEALSSALATHRTAGQRASRDGQVHDHAHASDSLPSVKEALDQERKRNARLETESANELASTIEALRAKHQHDQMDFQEKLRRSYQDKYEQALSHMRAAMNDEIAAELKAAWPKEGGAAAGSIGASASNSCTCDGGGSSVAGSSTSGAGRGCTSIKEATAQIGRPSKLSEASKRTAAPAAAAAAAPAAVDLIAKRRPSIPAALTGASLRRRRRRWRERCTWRSGAEWQRQRACGEPVRALGRMTNPYEVRGATRGFGLWG